MRVTPKISDSPAPTRNNDEAPASPLSSWTTNPEISMGRPCLRSCSGRGAQLLHIVVGRQVLRAVVVLVVDHRARAIAIGRLADIRAHRRLVIERRVGDL